MSPKFPAVACVLILYAASGTAIGEYNAKTGPVINSDFISEGEALAFSGEIKNLGHTIFVLVNGTVTHPRSASTP